MSTTILCDHRFISGKIPERPNGSDCKSDVFDFGSSNLPLPTTKKAISFRVSLFWLARGNCRSAVFTVVRASGAGKKRSAFPFCFFRAATLPRFARVCTSSHHRRTAKRKRFCRLSFCLKRCFFAAFFLFPRLSLRLFPFCFPHSPTPFRTCDLNLVAFLLFVLFPFCCQSPCL